MNVISFFCTLLVCQVAPIGEVAGSPPSGTKPITIEWMVKESGKYDDHLPTKEKWSPEGNVLSYLITDSTAPPDFVIFNATRNATETVLTPRTLGDLLHNLDKKPGEDNANSDTEPKQSRIYDYQWLTNDTVRLHADGRVFIYRREDRSIEEIKLPPGEKRHTKYSPDGNFIAFTRDYDLYAYDLEQPREIRLTRGGNEYLRNGELDWVYPEELQIRQGFYWSPDSRSIAYLQLNEEGVTSYPITDFSPIVPETTERLYPKAGTKNPAARVGVVTLSNRSTRWIDLGYPYEYIARVKWSPEGDFIAIQALDRSQKRLALLFADPSDGSSEMILEETDPHWVNVHDGPFWLESEEDFLWLSERDGYCHLYRIAKKGESVRQLTKGEWEVTRFVAYSSPTKEIFFEATKESPIERHIYRVSSKGGRIHRVTQGHAFHSASVSASGKYVYDRSTNVKLPRQCSILSRKGEVVRVLGEVSLADYEPYRMVIPEFLEIQGEGDRVYHARIYKPANFEKDKHYPVVFQIYGGPHGQVVQNRFDDMFSQVLVEEGFLVFSMDNRGSAGRGHVWETPIYRHFGQTELTDILVGVEYLKSYPYADMDRMGMWGWSFGGYLTCYAMLKSPDTFRAGAAVAPVTDWRLYDTIYTERYMGHPDDNPEGYHDSSPVYFAEALEGSLLLAHGISDDNVHVQNTYKMVDALLRANKEYEFYAYPQKSHGIWGDEHRIHLFNRILDFFKDHLKK